MTSNRKFSNKKKFKDAYKQYESLRDKNKKKKAAEKTQDDVYDFFRTKYEDDNFVESLTASSNPEAIAKSLETASQEENNEFELASLLKSASKGVGYVSKRIDADTAKSIMQSSVQLRGQVESLGKDAIALEEAKGNAILEQVINVAEVTFIVLAAGASFIKAYNRLDFNYWLKRELVKRVMLQKEIAQLDVIEVNKTPPENTTWESIENNIFKDEDEFTQFSRKKYRDALKENIGKVFELRDKDPEKLEKEEKDFLNDNEYITEDNLHLILANLERRHLNQQLMDVEEKVQDRLLANMVYSRKDNRSDFMVTMDEGVKKTLDNYIDMTDTESELIQQVKQLKAGIIPASEGEKIITALKDENDFIEQLEKKTNEKSKDLAAKMLIFTAVVLSAAIVITLFVTPGAQPALIVMGVIALAALVTAHLIKPGILKQMKDEIKNDFSSFFGKIKKEFMYLVDKREVKQAINEKNNLNAIILDTVKDAKEKDIISDVSQNQTSVVEKKSLAKLKELLSIDFTILKDELLEAKTRHDSVSFFTNPSVTEQMMKLDAIINVINETDLTELHKVIDAVSENFNDFSSKGLLKDTVKTIENIKFTIKQINQDLQEIEQQEVSRLSV